MIWYDFGPIRTSGSIVSTLTLHSLTGTLKDPGSFILGQVWVSCASVRLVANDGAGNDYNEDDGPIYTDNEYEELEEAFQNS